MKKNTISKFLICTLLISNLIFVSGCGEKKEEVPIVHPMDITIGINYPDKSEIDDIDNVDFTVEKDTSVLDATELYCNVNEIPVNIETTSSSLTAINNVENGQYNSKKWKYKINGKICDTVPNEKILKAGDSLEWVYR